MLQIKLNQEQLARYGVPAKVVTDVIESIGSKPLGEVIEGQLRFPLVVRLPESMRDGAAAIGVDPDSDGVGRAAAAVAAGRHPRWSKGRRRSRASGASGGSRSRPTCAAATWAASSPRPSSGCKDKLTLPPGRYFYEFGGQFEHLQRARTRLLIVVPLALVLIFALLYLTYHNVVDALRVFTGVPFGWVGGIFALWLRDMPFSISAAIGFIALSGVAVLDDMILVSYIRQLAAARACRWTRRSMQAAITRLRPVLMTTLVASLGFLPMAFSTGMGAEVQRPLATVVIGGVIGAMVMSLLVLRVLYLLFKSPAVQPGPQIGFDKAQQLVELGSA